MHIFSFLRRNNMLQLSLIFCCGELDNVIELCGTAYKYLNYK